MRLRLFAWLAVVALAGLLPGAAQAGGWWHANPKCDPDSVGAGNVTINDSLTGNFWSFEVDYEVFAPDNCANPKPVKGSFTYVYTVTFSDEAIPNLSLLNMRVEVASAAFVSSAGYLTGGPGVAPVSVTVDSSSPANNVTAAFADGALSLGDTSLPVFIVSPYQPGSGIVNLQVTAFSGAGAALVPSGVPQACPCTSTYWVLRNTGWIFFLADFPGSQLEQIKQRAVDLSGGFFTSKNDLVGSLIFSGILDVKKKAKKELAALLLNVAAGDLFPANTKCRLFLGTQLDEDGDGSADGTVAGAIGQIISEIQSGDFGQQLDALSTAAQINNGQDVLGATLFH
ncbi:MAG TPA: hypothetical protein VMR86_22080 [Myxococcota bacterium]|nr:hypothetical protein [Myxococcota bacterium]